MKLVVTNRTEAGVERVLTLQMPMWCPSSATCSAVVAKGVEGTPTLTGQAQATKQENPKQVGIDAIQEVGRRGQRHSSQWAALRTKHRPLTVCEPRHEGPLVLSFNPSGNAATLLGTPLVQNRPAQVQGGANHGRPRWHLESFLSRQMPSSNDCAPRGFCPEQPAQHAGGSVRSAFLNPMPPKDTTELPNMLRKHAHSAFVCPAAKLCSASGLTTLNR